MKLIAARKRILFIVVCLLIFQLIPVTSVSSAEDNIWYYMPTPQGDIGVKKPPILWTVVGINSKDIEDISMTIDGVEVEAIFRDDLNSVFYIPQQSLAEGQHRVSIVIALKKGIKISSPAFNFNVVEGAFKEVPNSPVYHEVIDRINYYRRLTGLPPVELNKSLNKAAYNHSLYLTNNPGAGHYENNKNDPYYSGNHPWDRTGYFGYFSPVIGEDIHFVNRHLAAVDDWVDSVYHRFPIINPGYTQLGYGYAANGNKYFNVLDMGGPGYINLERRIVVYPAEGQLGVPVTWSGLEDPDPFRLYPEAEGPGGYPITLSVSGNSIGSVELLNASLINGEGINVGFYTFDAANDFSIADSNSIALIPKHKLDTYTSYRVKISGQIKYNDGREEKFTKEWEFTTGGGELETYENDAGLKVYIDGSRKEFDPMPFIKNGRTLIPVRSFCEELGALVKWHHETYTVEILKEDMVITFDIGSTKTLVNNKQMELDVPAALFQDRTFVPLRFVSEILGYKVEWDGVSRSVLIYSK